MKNEDGMMGSLEEARGIFHNPLINWGAFYKLWHCFYPITVISVSEPLQHHADSLVLSVQMINPGTNEMQVAQYQYFIMLIFQY